MYIFCERWYGLPMASYQVKKVVKVQNGFHKPVKVVEVEIAGLGVPINSQSRLYVG